MRRLALTLGLMGLLAGDAAASVVVTGWEETPDQNECVRDASRAVASVGFRVAVSNDRQTIFGGRGEDQVAIRCVGDRRIAVFFVALFGNAGGAAATGTMDAMRLAFRTEPSAVPPTTGGGAVKG